MNFICFRFSFILLASLLLVHSAIERNKHRSLPSHKKPNIKIKRTITQPYISISLASMLVSIPRFLLLTIVIRIVKHLLLDLIALLQCSFKRYLRCTFISVDAIVVDVVLAALFVLVFCQFFLCLLAIAKLHILSIFLLLSTALFRTIEKFIRIDGFSLVSFSTVALQFDWDFVCSPLLLDSSVIGCKNCVHVCRIVLCCV